MVLDKSISIETAYETIVSKLKTFFKDCGRTKAVLGLSGGIDSALVAALAADALGAKNVHGVLMPSQFSTYSPSPTVSNTPMLTTRSLMSMLPLPSPN